MSKSALISIVMPVKNAALYLQECLDSVLQQTYNNWELLAVDDHSSDDSFSILQKYSKRDQRVQVFQLEKGENGIIPALQLGYQNSTGEYVTRMDADDFMRKNKLSLLSAELQVKGKGHVAIGMVSYFCDNGVGDGYQKYADWLNELTCAESNFSEIYRECVVPSPCWMMARSDFEMIDGFESDLYPEDYDLCFRMRNNKLKVVGVKEVLHDWRDHASRASRNDPNYLDNQFLQLKLFHFINVDLNKDATIVLWGAGRKGKNIAKKLIENAILFKWVTNNYSKIGHDIYDVVLKSDADIFTFTNMQVIVAISSPEERRIAVAKLESKGLKLGVDYFPFC